MRRKAPTDHDATTSILTLSSTALTALTAVLLIRCLISRKADFVSKLSVGDRENRIAWMGNVRVSELKTQPLNAVAISAVELLKAFLVSAKLPSSRLAGSPPFARLFGCRPCRSMDL